MTTHCELCGRELSTFRAINNTPICSRCETDLEAREKMATAVTGPGCIIIEGPWTEQRLQEDLDQWKMEEEGTIEVYRNEPIGPDLDQFDDME